MQCLYMENSTLALSTWKTLKARSVLVNKFHSWLKYGFFSFSTIYGKGQPFPIRFLFSIWRNIHQPHRQEPNKNRNGFWKLMAFGSIWFPIYTNPLKSHTQLQAAQIPLTNFNFCDSIVNCCDYNWTHDLINDCLYSGHLNLLTKGQKNEI